MKVDILCHSLLTILAGVVLSEDYFENFTSYKLTPIENIPLGVKILYLCSLSYHMTSFMKIFNLETNYKYLYFVLLHILCWYEYFTIPIIYIVFWTFVYLLFFSRNINVMDVHHIVTVFLIVLSWQYHLNIIGGLVMFLNDITDAPMCALRLLNKQHPPKDLKFLFDIGILLLACIVWILWAVYRVFFMGYIIYKSSLFYYYYDYKMLTQTEHVVFSIMIISLLTLFMLNLFWGFLLTRKMVQKIK